MKKQGFENIEERFNIKGKLIKIIFFRLVQMFQNNTLTTILAHKSII